MRHLITFPSGQITTNIFKIFLLKATLVNNIALIKPSGQCCYIVYYNNSTSQREDMGLGVQLRLGKCLYFLVCLCGCLHTSQGTVRFIFCDNLKFRSLFVMVIAFSRAGSLAVYKNFVDPFFFKGLNRDSSEDVLLMMMVEETFSYLNIKKIISAQVEDGDECGFACAANPKCLSCNLEASISVTGTRRCELLPSDKYNNSDKFSKNDNKFHHYSIWVSDLVQYYLKFCVL